MNFHETDLKFVIQKSIPKIGHIPYLHKRLTLLKILAIKCALQQ